MRNQLIATQKSLTKRINELQAELKNAQKGEYETGELNRLSQVAGELQNTVEQLRAVQNILVNWVEDSNESALSRSERETTPAPNLENQPENTPPVEETEEKTESPDKKPEAETRETPEEKKKSAKEDADLREVSNSPADEIEDGSDQKSSSPEETTEAEPKESSDEKSESSNEEVEQGSDQKEKKRYEEIPLEEIKAGKEPGDYLDWLRDKKGDSEKKKDKKFSLELESGFMEQLGNGPLNNLKEAIGLNERFLFSNELFNGNMEAFNRALNELNHLENTPDAERLINEQLAPNYKWDIENEAVERFISLVKRRFAAKN